MFSIRRHFCPSILSAHFKFSSYFAFHSSTRGLTKPVQFVSSRPICKFVWCRFLVCLHGLYTSFAIGRDSVFSTPAFCVNVCMYVYRNYTRITPRAIFLLRENHLLHECTVLPTETICLLGYNVLNCVTIKAYF